MTYKELLDYLDVNIEYSNPYMIKPNRGIQEVTYRGTRLGWLETFTKNFLSPIEEWYFIVLPDKKTEKYKKQLKAYKQIEAEDEDYTEYYLHIDSDWDEKKVERQIFKYLELMYKIVNSNNTPKETEV